ncbi:MAG: aminodeoxychorismate/anthranilate synthase component II [Bacteroidales bacterium]|nr:aminodeoxychorismate/anthranilate synthase component II [Bacteroidales bacterium]HOM37486.1 aminodeoxychorismate/anthranilate synthase component II [Bacteroidales bacterium]HPD23044.1 aminodeoxychorismate/anthranilate synthase component II [Bacteroidales bacterium]HRS98883.1 aminodeoxychorismate/anthranilate synthase component II [Bacteroidales bacterium]HRT79387.1 aminodeoxychorismate/anthranilate synthase component II [Bacteroidales bacterium]
MIKIFLLDNHDSFTYNLASMFNSYKNIKLEIYNPENTNIAKINNFDKIIFSPGPGLPNEFPIMQEILENYKTKKHFLGVCLGHQSIGEFFGAKLKNYNEVKHGRMQKLKILKSNSLLLKNIPDNSLIGVYHSWYIDEINFPEEFCITGTNEDGIIMSIEHNFYNIQSVQFHPESFITKFGYKIIDNWVNNK